MPGSVDEQQGSDGRPATAAATAADLLLDRLQQHVHHQPDKRAITFLEPASNNATNTKSSRLLPTGSLTYQELDRKTTEVAKLILSKGVKVGDCVVLVYPPSLDFMVAFLACVKAHVVAVPVFPPHPLQPRTVPMFAKICASCQATVALTNRTYQYQKKMSGIKDSLTSLVRSKTLVWPDQLQWVETDSKLGGTSLSSANKLSKPDVSLPTTPPARTDLCFLQYTSGSTSDPKGVMITHGNIAHNLNLITEQLAARDDTVVVSWLPQYHDMGLIGSYLGCLYCGGSGYYFSPLAFLQRPRAWLQAVAEFRATHLQAPNFAFVLTARKMMDDNNGMDDGTLDLSSVRHIINAAEPVTEHSIKAFGDACAQYGLRSETLYPTYGLAEHTVFVCSNGQQRLTVDKKVLEEDGKVEIVADDGDTNAKADGGAATRTATTTMRLLGCGVPSVKHGVVVRIVDSDASGAPKVLPPNTVGEIWVHSDSKAAGYYNMPYETKTDFGAKLDDDDESSLSFLRTGDLGFIHNDELFICGRLKDLIIVGGRNYYPQDIEATAEVAGSARLRPGCSAAFSMNSDQDESEQVALVAELKDPVSSGCAELAQQIKAAINKEHALGLSKVVLVKPRTVPKTSSGKIARAWSRKALKEKSLKIIYETSFTPTSSPSSALEIEGSMHNRKSTSGGNGASPSCKPPSTTHSSTVKGKDAASIRSMGKGDLMDCLKRDIARVASIDPSLLESKTAMTSVMDSLTLSQFKGLLETNYHVQLSDEYLFRESTTVQKLVEVVKIGHAPDDGDGNDAAAGGGGQNPAMVGQAKGLAGALGCPPGVRCVIL